MNKAAVPDLSSRDLEAVCTIAECGSFMAASLTRAVSQPAITRTVKRVEEALGLVIFQRTTRRLEVTPAGQEFIALANRVLSDLRISYESMREVSDEQRGQVIVSTVMSAAYVQMPAIVSKYHALRPLVEIQVREGVHGHVLEDVRSGIADLGITYIDDIPREFIGTPLSHEAFHVVMPRTHVLATQTEVKLGELVSYALVSLPRDAQTRRLIEGLASVAGIQLRHAVTVSQFSTLMQFVQEGVGIAIVPGGAIPSALSAGLVSRPMSEPVVSRTLGAVVLRDRALTPSAVGLFTQLQLDWAQ
jgi:DNA-binding transcriptional LysR family regulator